MRTPDLTRGEALDLIDDSGEALLDLQALSVHWLGHDNADLDAEELADMLREYVNECAFNGDDERSHGPKDRDRTGLTAP